MSRALFIRSEKVDTIRRIPNLIQSILLRFVFSIEYELLPFTQLLDLVWYHHWVTHFYIYIRRASYSASTCHLDVMGSTLRPPTFFLWRSHRASLYRCTRREIATWVVTDIIWKRCSLQTTFLNKDPPSIPPTMLAANWSMSSLPSFPRRPKRSTARVTKFMAALVEGHLSYTSVVIALSHLSSVGS